MFKIKTVKLLAVTFLVASTTQAIAAQGGDLASVEQQGSHWVDFSDPSAIYSKVGLGTGTEGVDVYAALGGYLGGQFEQMLTIESLHDMSYVNVNYLAFNKSNDTGFSLDTTWGDEYSDISGSEYNEISIGVVKKLLFNQNPNLKVYPAMKFGLMWDWDDSIQSTNFVELDASFRYNVDRNLWFGVTPSYRYALDGENIKDLNGMIDAGYQLSEEVAVSAHANNDKEVWADFTFAF